MKNKTAETFAPCAECGSTDWRFLSTQDLCAECDAPLVKKMDAAVMMTGSLAHVIPDIGECDDIEVLTHALAYERRDGGTWDRRGNGDIEQEPKAGRTAKRRSGAIKALEQRLTELYEAEQNEYNKIVMDPLAGLDLEPDQRRGTAEAEVARDEKANRAAMAKHSERTNTVIITPASPKVIVAQDLGAPHRKAVKKAKAKADAKKAKATKAASQGTLPASELGEWTWVLMPNGATALLTKLIGEKAYLRVKTVKGWGKRVLDHGYLLTPCTGIAVEDVEAAMATLGKKFRAEAATAFGI